MPGVVGLAFVGGAEDVLPVVVLPQGVAVAEDPAGEARAGEEDVEAVLVLEEADGLDVAALRGRRRRADAGDEDEVLLAALERVDGRDLDVEGAPRLIR